MFTLDHKVYYLKNFQHFGSKVSNTYHKSVCLVQSGSTELMGCKEMTRMKLETAAGLQFAEPHLVADDMKSDDLGCL